jgi:hypothetical protein
MQTLQIGESVMKPITAATYWNETQLLLEKGNTYDLEILPKDQVWTDGNEPLKKATDADGFSNILNLWNYLKRARHENWFALMGCINKNESTFFKIGFAYKNYTPPESGELVCFANDASEHYGNNKGTLFLTIKRVS